MKALRWYGRKDVRYEDAPEPSAGGGEIKAKIHVAGICGTDLNILAIPPRHQATPNIIIGHEGVGIVEAVGTEEEMMTDLGVGDRVIFAKYSGTEVKLEGKEAEQMLRLMDGLEEGIKGDLHHKCKGRSAPARLARAIQQADQAGLNVPKLKDIQTQGNG